MTRADLPPGDQAVQAAHAALDFAAAEPVIFRRWQQSSNTLALLAAPDELELCWLLERARRARVTAVPFREPDLGGELTAVALEPGGRALCRTYPLALAGGDVS